MTCYYPLLGLQQRFKNKNGKYPVKIFARTEEMSLRTDPIYWRGGNTVLLPCGKCIACRLDYAREWAIRCHHEASLHDKNCFITLTYNNENLPSDRSVSKRELQLFIKRLRKSIEPKRIRFYGCGEYGDDIGQRPHYHIIVFGYDFDDKETHEALQNRKKGKFQTGVEHILYISKALDKIWRNSNNESKGFTTVGEVTLESAGYVARYSVKKIYGEMAEDHYQGREPEFALMSNGIGKDWILAYGTDAFPKDFITVNGYKNKPPKYYMTVMEGKRPDIIKGVKEKRIKKASENFHSRKRLLGKEKYKKLVTRKLTRRL